MPVTWVFIPVFSSVRTYTVGPSPLLKQPVRVVLSPEAVVAVVAVVLLSVVLRVSEEAVVVVGRGVFGSVVVDSVAVRVCVFGLLVEAFVVVRFVVVEPLVGEEGVEALGPSFAHPPSITESTKVPGIIHIDFIYSSSQ